MKTYELDNAEEQLILRYRQEREAEAYAKRFVLHVLEIAAKFEQWRQQTGTLGQSYTTFLDDFGYQPVDGIPHRKVWKKVCEVINVVMTEMPF